MSKTISKSKKYFKRSFHPKKKLFLEVNLKGFLCSCNNREKDCIKEAYNLLNEYADQANPPSPHDDLDDEDIADSLTKEISQLKPKDKRFQVVESGAKNFLFIRTTVENPVELAHTILQDILDGGTQKTKFLLRLIPVEVTCKANLGDIAEAFARIAERRFKDSPCTFCVVFNHRNNNQVSRDEVIKMLADKVLELRGDHKVDLKGAQMAVIVEVIRGFAFLSVVPDYFKYKKYNLLSVCE